MRNLAAVATLPLLTLVLPAQENTKKQEPEYVGVVMYLNATTGALQPLERQQHKTSTKVKGLGFGGGTASMFFEGAKSPVRFKAGQDIEFVVRGLTPDVEPDSQVNLDVLTVSKDQRQIIIAKAKAFGGSKTTTGETLRPLTFAKYGEQSTKFSPSPRLAPGEYVITTRGASTGFLFGVDPE